MPEDVTLPSAGRETPLDRALADGERRPTPLDAMHAARERFLAGERVEVSAIADELGVSRVTLHRWVGNRAALLGAVMAQLAVSTIEREHARQGSVGGARLAMVATHLVRSLMTHDGMRALLDREPAFALRVLTTDATSAQRRIIDAWTSLIEREVADGYVPPLAPRDLAYLVVRLCESFVYRAALTGEASDPDDAATLFGLVLDPVRPASPQV